MLRLYYDDSNNNADFICDILKFTNNEFNFRYILDDHSELYVRNEVFMGGSNRILIHKRIKSILCILLLIFILNLVLYFIGIPPAVKINSKWYFTYTNKLNIHIFKDEDTENLKYFKFLKELSFYGENTKNIDFLKNMKKIEKLSLYNVAPENAEAISFCNNIKELVILDSKITDLSVLENMDKITNIYIVNSLCYDFASFEYLEENGYMLENVNSVNSEVLTVPISEKANMEFVSEMNKLTDITVFTNNINISSIYECENLKHLSIYNGKIESICGIENLCDLQELRISTSRLSDISCLKELKKLKILYISNKDTFLDITALRKMEWLEELHVTYSKLSNSSDELNQIHEYLTSKGVKVFFENNESTSEL